MFLLQFTGKMADVDKNNIDAAQLPIGQFTKSELSIGPDNETFRNTDSCTKCW